MELNYTIVPALDHEASARFFARIFWLHYDGLAGHFAPVQVNESLTLDLDTATEFDSHHAQPCRASGTADPGAWSSATGARFVEAQGASLTKALAS